MRTTLSISMYSGRQPPETDMTEEDSLKAMELAWLALKANVPFNGPHHYGLSSDHYHVHWEPMCLGNIPVPVRALMSHPTGFLRIYRGNGDQGVVVKDVVGLWAHLAKIGGPLLAAHIEEGNEQMKKYWESIGVPLPEIK